MSAPSPADLAAWVQSLAELEPRPEASGPGLDDATRVALLRALSEARNAVSAAELRVAHAFEESQRAVQRAAGKLPSQVGEGVAAQVGLARRESPHQAARTLGLARALVSEMPHTLHLLGRGHIDVWTATLMARETACLDEGHRRTIDQEIAGSGRPERLSRKQLVAQTRAAAARLDSAGVAERQALAAAERRVTLRPAPETMTYLTALVPVEQGVAMYASLRKAAEQARAAGETRGLGQHMADTLVGLVTGRAPDVPPPVELRLVMTDKTLLAGDAEPAVLPGYDVLPAEYARDLVSRALGSVAVWVRRLYTAPTTGQLMAMDSRRRTAPAGLAGFIADRDQNCRTPWCGAPVRHVDHVVAHREVAETVADGLQGLCERCSYAKEALGWTALPRPGPVHTVETTTPTGHRYLSLPPPPPGGGDPAAA